jgi:hypothetical protein
MITAATTPITTPSKSALQAATEKMGSGLLNCLPGRVKFLVFD